VSAGIAAGAARLGLATFAVAVAFATMSHPSRAQDSGAPAGAPPPAAAPDAATKLAKGRELFANYACGSCHTLADAGADGRVGPPFDGDANLTEAYVVNRVTNGQGGMPAFGDQLSQDEITAIAAYVTHAASK
jgi:mono/diheme cytochrome c family protein